MTILECLSLPTKSANSRIHTHSYAPDTIFITTSHSLFQIQLSAYALLNVPEGVMKETDASMVKHLLVTSSDESIIDLDLSYELTKGLSFTVTTTLTSVTGQVFPMYSRKTAIVLGLKYDSVLKPFDYNLDIPLRTPISSKELYPVFIRESTISAIAETVTLSRNGVKQVSDAFSSLSERYL